MNRYGKRCVLYPRVSTEMQVDGYSLEGQKNMLTRFADREEMIVVDTYEDAGKSGKSIEGRPAFQKMLRDIEDGLDIDYILVYKLSRFGRNAADILNSLELVQSYGVNLICIEEGIDSSQTSGKLLISVLSAVAEIERENIIEQTMNGRREKARQGGWNGGFAPYGYTLEDNKLMIEETEAVAIRKIFELYTSSEIGLGGIANQLNLQGIRKIPRQNGTLEDWTGHFIKLILDNPVYCGKIAYGRRTKEKVKGTKNDYQMKRNDDYILTEGQHKGIVSEEVWEKAHAKRLRTGVKQPSKIGRDRVHLLSGLLKCPVCGSPMYTNKHAWTNKDGTYKEIYYYVCSRNRMVRGKHCEYKAMLKKTDIEPMVIEAIREIVRNEEYAQAIKKRIGVQIDTKAVDKELEGYQAKLKEVDLNKTRLEREIDSLPADAKYRERKLHDMTLRLDSLYDVIVELEEKIEDARLRRDAIKQQAITLENIYKIMVNFDCVYNIINDEEKRNVVTALIKEIEIYRNDESEYPLKRIGLNFPVFKDGGEVTELLWDKGNTVETFTLLSNNRPYYPELLTMKRVNDDFDFFKRLHECILTRCTAELRDADLLDLFDIIGIDISDEQIDSFGDKEYILDRIAKELDVQFNTRKQLLLKTLYAYIANSSTLDDLDCFSMFGTNSFSLVWEKVCAEVMDNQLQKPIGGLRLPVPLAEQYRDIRHKKLIDLIDKPQWAGTAPSGEPFVKQAEDTLIPDLISIVNVDGNYQFIIFDAKYYNIQLEHNKRLRGQPGIESITKQYLYQLAYQPFAEAHQINTVRNCFLMPTDSAEVVEKGTVSLSMLSNLGLQDIQVRLLPAETVYRHYLENTKMDIRILNL